MINDFNSVNFTIKLNLYDLMLQNILRNIKNNTYYTIKYTYNIILYYILY